MFGGFGGFLGFGVGIWGLSGSEGFSVSRLRAVAEELGIWHRSV